MQAQSVIPLFRVRKLASTYKPSERVAKETARLIRRRRITDPQRVRLVSLDNKAAQEFLDGEVALPRSDPQGAYKESIERWASAAAALILTRAAVGCMPS
jgi:hypothetical protein